ncbi:cytochrome C biogenesis protein CycX [Kiloniella litopenaei]|uniref:Heme exporter protein D n=1 Tax=Kiloniella litopenaei TaxID=1549748 RepID=A0A0M2R2B6_9PROT|nr:heme exporter protein CcmD [Kiloniella litopenaei]KKJ76037.1 cytochrome C biogenesis protein CycX [Kiloniella litopenaei]
MEQITNFLSMGNYGAYIWTAYLLTAVVMLGLLVTTLQRLRKNKAELEEFQNLQNSTKQSGHKEETARP